MPRNTYNEFNVSLSQLLSNGQANNSRRPETAVILPPPPAANISRKFEATAELWSLLDAYVDFVLEQNGYTVSAQTREAMFPLIISDRLRASIAQDKYFKAHLDRRETSGAGENGGEQQQHKTASVS